MDLGIPRLDGAVHPAYANPRPEVAALVPPRATRVLDVGCSVGAMGVALQERGHTVTGIEYEPELAAEARKVLAGVHEGNVETFAAEGKDPGGPFDCVCFADVLEHLRDPWAVVRWAEGLLAPDGTVVVSVPNIRRFETLWYVFGKRTFPYTQVGVFDRTHLRFFAKRDVPRLFAGTSLRIEEWHRVQMLSFDPDSFWNKVAPLFGDLSTLQFVVRARRQR